MLVHSILNGLKEYNWVITADLEKNTTIFKVEIPNDVLFGDQRNGKAKVEDVILVLDVKEEN